MSLSVSHQNLASPPISGDGQGTENIRSPGSTVIDSVDQTQVSSHKAAVSLKPSSSAFDHWLCSVFLKTLGNPPIKMILWDGVEIGTSPESPIARVFVGNRATLRRLILDPEFQFGEVYSQGLLEVSGDLCEFLDIIYRLKLQRGFAKNRLKNILSLIIHTRRPNTVAASRENIHQHYDIGNDFYQLWLDKEMIYSCAYSARITSH